MSAAGLAESPPAATSRHLRTLGRVFSLSVQEAMTYRVEGAIWFLYDLLPPLIILATWLAAYRDMDSIGGYSLGSMLVYYIGVIGLRALITTHQEYAINYDVRHGDLANLLVKPVNLWLYWLANEAAWKVWRLALVTPVTLALALWFRDEIAWPTPAALAPALLACVFAFALCFLLKQCLGYLSFWFIQLDGVIQAYELCSILLSGELLPIDLLPPAWQTIAQALPFAYLYYFPLQVALGKATGAALWTGLAIQAGWIAAVGLLSMALWRRGLRHFEGVGL
jgi:ABC-2 type transport system permease protein